jgi:hypothetical protein
MSRCRQPRLAPRVRVIVARGTNPDARRGCPPAASGRKLARAIYDGRAFGQAPFLADALEEAGCDSADVLAHCRSGGEHVRGCWAVDLLLGKA